MLEVLGGRKIACSTCENVTCHCPIGLSIPRLMISQHADMLGLEREELIPQPPVVQNRRFGQSDFGASVLN